MADLAYYAEWVASGIIEELRPYHWAFFGTVAPWESYTSRYDLTDIIEQGKALKWDREYQPSEFYRCECGEKCEDHGEW